jgi:hypothetical protein
MAEYVPWLVAIRPALRWVWRWLPTRLFRRHYGEREVERDIRLTCEASDPIRLNLPGELQAPSLEFWVKVLNASPYLDVRVSAVHCFLTARNQSITGSVFAQFSRWDALDLPRGRCLPFRCEFWLNEFQLGIVKKFMRGEAWITASFTVWVESKIGRVHASRSFDLPKPSVS